jgi:hypothetical protein
MIVINEPLNLLWLLPTSGITERHRCADFGYLRTRPAGLSARCAASPRNKERNR